MEVMELLSSLLLTGASARASLDHVLAFLPWVRWSAVGPNKDVCVSPNHAQSTQFSPDGIQSRRKNNDHD